MGLGDKCALRIVHISTYVFVEGPVGDVRLHNNEYVLSQSNVIKAATFFSSSRSFTKKYCLSLS
jgi:hypothetical protein